MQSLGMNSTASMSSTHGWRPFKIRVLPVPSGWTTGRTYSTAASAAAAAKEHSTSSSAMRAEALSIRGV